MSEQGNIRQDRDLVLPPGTYAYVLDETKGKISVYVGPFKNSLSNTDKLVVWRDGRFVPSEGSSAVHTFVKAGEGQYIVLNDPAKDAPESFPPNGTASDAITLDAGSTIVIPGPAMFPLWPGQAAQVIDGHHLRHNQYLVVRVYEPTEAQANFERAVIAPSASGTPEDEPALDVSTLTMGQLVVIKGTDVSFYVPPTGIEVVPEKSGQFVREAPTLEQLEYCVLRDENGNKRFERGPAVVFPEPTETFVTDEDGSRKFRAIELNPQSGLYIKVIAAYTDDDGVEHSEGEELFLTGRDTPIYFPRVEHSIIQYGEKRKHHAIAIPAGEGRYVLDRTTGEVELISGPKMFLADPRTQVIVRRVLDPRTVAVMYPGNTEALRVNQEYDAKRRARSAGGFLEADAMLADEEAGREYASLAATPSAAFAGEKMRRGTEYTPPRTITLDTKYDGAVAVSVWPGYAVLVMDKSGNRRVEVGPKNILLEYDETLMTLSLSTGRPKDDKLPLKTAYLRTINNAVSDRVTVETRDLVPVTIDLSLRVNFEGDADEAWFDVEDYIALLTDHCRSRLRNVAKRHGIREFYENTIDIIRDALLGESTDGSRTGLVFKENAMRLYDVEVLAVSIESSDVEELLSDATSSALEGAIKLSEAEDTAEREARLEKLRRDTLAQEELTREAEAHAQEAAVERTLRENLARVEADLRVATERARIYELDRAETDAVERQAISLTQARNAVVIDRLRAEVEQAVIRLSAVQPDLIAAIQSFGDKAFVEQITEALAPAALASGVTTVDMLHQIFKDTPFEGITETLSQRPLVPATNGGTER